MRFKHDCSKCKPLGEFGKADLYFCQQGGDPTVIARYSDEGGDYQSGLLAAGRVPDLGEARSRAIAAGFLPPAPEVEAIQGREAMRNWLIDKEAEYQMRGLGKRESKEKAMEDWHTYMSTDATGTACPKKT